MLKRLFRFTLLLCLFAFMAEVMEASSPFVRISLQAVGEANLSSVNWDANHQEEESPLSAQDHQDQSTESPLHVALPPQKEQSFDRAQAGWVPGSDQKMRANSPQDPPQRPPIS